MEITRRRLNKLTLYGSPKEVNKYVITLKTFDWREAGAANYFRGLWKGKGYSVIDLGTGTDTYVLVVVKKGVKVK
jgi:hypothetical protein